ncbi:MULTISPECIES: hypothetical protein [unclassified Bosea (in: a-proteobacteria)]|jgi:hypothetical protein|nr:MULTISPECIES: hypothetical protein [unclassified Bosea (in: a-proteobacteria)]CAD5295158.1 hypothetical protein BOSE21B_90317 [Bosea sp. 21B]CAD5295551.1 hypothetical protein BOSE46_80409 [Bosea sp. 46]CAD5298310.1 hypothetical protein BOSE7B_60351 [Bosea sp. 7B]VVT60962.1 hypothetical protein BOS5A_230239 [Bosea sp. EC-HK365B]VXB34626.1 hypothetical protein BOSE127_110349 [Bosea sp. 127]
MLDRQPKPENEQQDDEKLETPHQKTEQEPETEPVSPRDYQEGFWN